MRRFARLLLRVVAVVAVLAAVGAVWAFWPEARPDLADLATPPDRYDVEIVRDEWGVPHVIGATDPDVAFGLAYAHAEDDFATIQQTLHAARGTLASVEGPGAAPIDFSASLLRVQEQVDAGWPSVPDDVRALLRGYADGLNHFAATHPEEVLPRLFPVEGRDLLAATVQKSPLFFGLDGVLAALFADGPLDLPEHDPFGVRPVYRDDRGDTDVGADTGPSARRRESPLSLRMRHGSNILAVGPDRTVDGSTLLAVNSHQPWSGPVAWYEASVHSETGWNVSGALFPGLPTIVLGANPDVAWTFTVNRPDLIDVYELEVDPDDPMRYRFDGGWRSFERDTASIDVRLAGRLRWTFDREVLWSVHGPVVRREDGVYAIRYPGFGDVGIIEQLYRMNRSTSLDAWREAVAARDGLPTFNIAAVARDGGMFYVYNALLPERQEGFDWWGVVPGDTADTLWEDILPFERLPQVRDPSSGFLQNANSSPFTAAGASTPIDPDDHPAGTTGIERFETNRSLRALARLDTTFPVSDGSFRDLKFDDRYVEEAAPAQIAERIAALDLDGEAAIGQEVLSRWSRSADHDDPAMALIARTLVLLLDHADIDLDPWRLTASLDRVPDALVAGAFETAVREVQEATGRYAPEWGEMMRLRRGDHDLRLSGGPDTLRAIYGVPDEDGRLRAIAGDSFIQMVRYDADGALDVRSVHQYGAATDDPSSPHYADQSPLFAEQKLKTAPLTVEAVRRSARDVYRPTEVRPPG